MQIKPVPLALVAALLAPAAAQAQQKEIAPEDLRKEVLADAEEARKDGWTPKLSIGSTAAYGHSSKVVGALDGHTVQIGILLDGEANLVKGQHDWENSLAIRHTQTQTPLMDRFIKSADSLDVVSTYMYRLEAIDWLGPYGRLKLNTQLFAGYEGRTDDTAVVRTASDGISTPDTVAAEANIDLTGPFEPMLLTETAGIFANPIEKKVFTLKAKLGAGAQEVVTNGGYKLADDDATPELELVQLEDSTQAGAEAELELSGEVSTNVTWKAKANFFLPFVTTGDDKYTGFDGLNSDLAAGVSVKLAKWASLDYSLSAKKIPTILDEWQVANGLMLSASFNLL